MGRMRARVMPCTRARRWRSFLPPTLQTGRQSRRTPVPHHNKTHAILISDFPHQVKIFSTREDFPPLALKSNRRVDLCHRRRRSRSRYPRCRSKCEYITGQTDSASAATEEERRGDGDIFGLTFHNESEGGKFENNRWNGSGIGASVTSTRYRRRRRRIEGDKR